MKLILGLMAGHNFRDCERLMRDERREIQQSCLNYVVLCEIKEKIRDEGENHVDYICIFLYDEYVFTSFANTSTRCLFLFFFLYYCLVLYYFCSCYSLFVYLFIQKNSKIVP